jgi:hypothetical protein
VRWAGYVAHVTDEKSINILVKITEETKTFIRLGRMMADNIKKDLKRHHV